MGLFSTIVSTAKTASKGPLHKAKKEVKNAIKSTLKAKGGDLAKRGGKEALGTLGEKVPLIGNLCEWATENLLGGDSEAEMSATRSKDSQKLVDETKRTADSEIATLDDLTKQQRIAIKRLQDDIDKQNGDLSTVWDRTNAINEGLQATEAMRDRTALNFGKLTAELGGAIDRFNVQVRQLSGLQKEVLAHLDTVEANMKSNVKLQLVEHEAWKAQRNIIKFYTEFQLHVSVATAEVKRGALTTIGESRNIQVFVKALLDPVAGVTAELFNLQCANELLDADPDSSRGALEASFVARATKLLRGDDTNTEKLITSGIQALMGAELTAYTLLCFIAPNRFYRRRLAQDAIDALLSNNERLMALIPSEAEVEQSRKKNALTLSYRHLYTSHNEMLGYVKSPQHTSGSLDVWSVPNVFYYGTNQGMSWRLNAANDNETRFYLTTKHGGEVKFIGWSGSRYEITSNGAKAEFNIEFGSANEKQLELHGLMFGEYLDGPSASGAFKITDTQGGRVSNLFQNRVFYALSPTGPGDTPRERYAANPENSQFSWHLTREACHLYTSSRLMLGHRKDRHFMLLNWGMVTDEYVRPSWQLEAINGSTTRFYLVLCDGERTILRRGRGKYGHEYDLQPYDAKAEFIVDISRATFQGDFVPEEWPIKYQSLGYGPLTIKDVDPKWIENVDPPSMRKFFGDEEFYAFVPKGSFTH